jgi:hypothetical protein
MKNNPLFQNKDTFLIQITKHNLLTYTYTFSKNKLLLLFICWNIHDKYNIILKIQLHIIIIFILQYQLASL